MLCYVCVRAGMRACVYFVTKCHETCNKYQVFHVRIFYLLIGGVYQRPCQLVEWDHLRSLQPLKSASESEKFCGNETNFSFSRMSSYAILLFSLLDKDYSMLHDHSSWLGYSALFKEKFSLSAP